MNNLTKSDLINIETFKSLIRLTNTEIKEVKSRTSAPSEKAIEVFNLHTQKAHLIQNAGKAYPHIDWINESEGTETGFKRSLIDTARLKAENRAVFNFKNKLGLN